jgi:GNAT superfamily N-acetyltransferase
MRQHGERRRGTIDSGPSARRCGVAKVKVGEVRRLDPPECEALIRALSDTPETVIAVHQLRHGLCEAYAEAGAGHHDAVVLRPSRPSDELMGFGRDVESLGLVLRGLEGWSCVCVEDGIVHRLGLTLEAQLGHPVRYIMDIYHTPERPVVAGSHPSVRYLTWEDIDLLSAAPLDIRGACLGFGTFERLLAAGVAVGAVIDGGLVAVASTWAVSEKYGDLAVVTAGSWRGRGLATACAGLVAEGIQRSGRVPVWSTGEDNLASLRVARKLGFEESGRRTYINIIAEDNEPR